MAKNTRPLHGAYHEPPKVRHVDTGAKNGDRSGTGRKDADGIAQDKPDGNGFSGKLPRK
jgi:hypothetical protein